MLRLLFSTFILCFLSVFSILAQSKIISDVIYLEKNDGLKQRIVKHVIRGPKGYFYLFSDNHIQQFDGKVFRDVDLNILFSNKLSLRNLSTVDKDENYVKLKFHDNSLLNIPAGKLYLQVKEEDHAFVDTTVVPVLEGELDINTNNGTYLWDSDYVYKLSGSEREVIAELPHKGNAPYFIRKDGFDNIIAAYNNEERYIEHFYVLDSSGILHDLSEVVNEYRTALDIYADDVFYKWMIAGYNGVKIVSFQREGLENIDKRPGVERGGFGNIIRGITATDEEIVFCAESQYVSRYSGITQSEWLEREKFNSTGFGQCKYDKEDNSFLIRGYDSKHPSLYEIKSGSNKVKEHFFLRDVRDYIFDKNSSLIVASINSKGKGEIFSYDRKTKESETLVSGLPPLSSIYYSVTLDQYWVGSKNGLFVFNDKFDLLSTFSMDAAGNKVILYDEIVMVAEYEDQMLACSDGGGVYIIVLSLKKKD